MLLLFDSRGTNDGVCSNYTIEKCIIHEMYVTLIFITQMDLQHHNRTFTVIKIPIFTTIKPITY